MLSQDMKSSSYMDITKKFMNRETSENCDNLLVRKLRKIEKCIQDNELSDGLLIVRQLLNNSTYLIKADIKSYNETYEANIERRINNDTRNIRLRIYTFGQFMMTLDDKPIIFRRKVQKRPLDLLKTIITLGGREISKSQLTELLWPDSAGDASVSVINTTLYRLRELIGKEAIITENGRISLNPEYCWIDCWEFEKILNSSKNPNVVKQDSIESVLDIYKGGFLSGEEFGWIIAKKDKLKNKLLYILNNYCHWLIKNKQLNTANTILEHCIRLDDLNEDYYLILMRCQISQNKFNDAIKTYRQCKLTLQNQLGILPSKQCEKIYQSIFDQSNSYVGLC